MRKLSFFILIFTISFILATSLVTAEKAEKKEAVPDVKAQKEEPFLWDLIFSNTKTVVPMVSTSMEIAMSPYPPVFDPKTEMMSNQERFTTGDRLLVQNHLWNEGDLEGSVNYYIAFLDLANPQQVYFFDGFGWGVHAAHQLLHMGVGFDRIDTIFDLRLPPNPPKGRYTFAAGLADPETGIFYGTSTVTIEIY